MPLLTDRIDSQTTLCLMLDYDGTLTPIIRNPFEAFLTEQSAQILRQLCSQKRIRIAFVSGRSLDELKIFLNPLLNEDILLCGSHGGEVYSTTQNRYLLLPRLDDKQNLLEEFKIVLVELLEQQNLLVKGLTIEDKPYTYALHYRNTTDEIRKITADLFMTLYRELPELADHYRIQPGKSVVEIVPKEFDKGRCVRFLAGHWQDLNPRLLSYVGDDFTDESAFVAVNQIEGLSVCVGKAPGETEATYTLPSVSALYDELENLYATLNAS